MAAHSLSRYSFHLQLTILSEGWVGEERRDRQEQQISTSCSWLLTASAGTASKVNNTIREVWGRKERRNRQEQQIFKSLQRYMDTDVQKA